MCFGQLLPNRSAISMDPPAVRDTGSNLRFTRTLEAMAAQPSWSLRKVFKPQPPVRPGLSRKLKGTAKIDLNKYWDVLEDLVHVETTLATTPPGDGTRRNVADYSDIGMANEINENLANERYEILTTSPPRSTESMDVDGSPPPRSTPSLPRTEPQSERPVVKKTTSPKSMATKSARSPLAVINGNQRKTPTPAKSAPKSRTLPLTPKSPVTALAENLQRRLCNRI